MHNRLRLLIHYVFFCTLSLFAISTAMAEPSDVPSYYSQDQQQTETQEKLQTETPTTAETNYEGLQNKLATYENAAAHQWPIIPDTARFRLDHPGHYVSLLRERLMLVGDLVYDDNSNIYDDQLMEAVKTFQKRHGLKADGAIGAKTRAQLNVSPEERIKQIKINMQRWSYLTKKLGHRYVMVNVPDFQLYLVEDDRKVMTMKAIVGKPTHQTPEVFSTISTVVFKPYWNIPDKIAHREIVAKVIEDPNYLDDNDIRVYRDEDHNHEMNPYDINWYAVEEEGREIHLRQQPGEKNALGLVKFEFPNPYDVYLHGTSAQNLFAEDVRDFSHGCVRLENPFALVSYLMKDKEEWSDEKLADLLANNKPTYVNVPEPIPVVITYITAWIDEDGNLNFRDDIYGRDNEPEYNPDAHFDKADL